MHTPQHPYDAVLREQVETEFQTLYGHLTDPIMLFDLGLPHCPIITCNESYARIHGYNRAEMMGMPVDFLNGTVLSSEEDDTAHRVSSIQSLRHDGQQWGRAGHLKKDGSRLLIEFSNRLITIAGRELVLSVEHSINPRKRVEQRQEFVADFQEFFQFLCDGAILVDPHTPDLRIVDCNSAFATMTGYTPEELAGTSLKTFHRSQDSQGYQEWLQIGLPDFIETLRLEGSLTFTGAYGRKDGTVFPVSYSHSLLNINGRELLLYVVHDISEEQRARAIERQRDEVLDAIAVNAPLPTILQRIALMMEQHISRSRCVIMLRQGDLWSVSAAPSLHEGEIEAVNSLYSDNQPPEVVAAFTTQQLVFLANIAAAESTHQPFNEHGTLSLPEVFDAKRLVVMPLLPDEADQYDSAQCVPSLRCPARACWVVPILNSVGQNLGVMILFLEQPGKPARTLDVDVIKRSASLVAISVEQRHHADMLAHQAEYDYLTDLPNRLLFEDRLRQSILRAKRYQQLLGVLFVDLDGFKHINDTLGHNAGDFVLIEVARRLRNCVRSSDTVARLGGDEFTLLLSDLKTPEDAAQIAQKVLNALQKPIEVMQHEVYVTGSIGIAIHPRDGNDDGALLRNADAAMYNAKSSGKNQYAFFEEAIGEAMQETQNLKVQLRQAFEQKQFAIFYQPVISLADGHIESFEALLRWHHPRLGTMLPVSFIPAAEETGIILKIGEWVLDEVCSQIALWQNDGWKPRVSLNISALQLVRTQLVDALKKPLSEYSLTPDCLELELAESVLMRDMQESKRQLEQLRRFGVKLTIDDFGTGYSSLTYLQKLPLHRIKIDQTFVKELETSETSRALVDAIVRLGHGLNLDIVAEGVSNANQMKILHELGCNFIQGNLIAKPLCAEKATKLLKNLHEGALSL